VVTGRELVELPLNRRNFTQLGLLQPGVAPLTAGLAEAGGSLRADRLTPWTGRGRNRITIFSMASRT
jgi:hypothetical protein